MLAVDPRAGAAAEGAAAGMVPAAASAAVWKAASTRRNQRAASTRNITPADHMTIFLERTLLEASGTGSGSLETYSDLSSLKIRLSMWLPNLNQCEIPTTQSSVQMRCTPTIAGNHSKSRGKLCENQDALLVGSGVSDEKVYGEWSPAIDDYVKEDIMNWTESEEYEKLIEITDPYSYRVSLDMPKYIINASSDEFFVTDSWQFYWDDLIGEKHLQYLPNAGHGLYGTYVTDDLINFYNQVINKKESPYYEWSIDQNTFNINIDPSADYQIKKWSINNSERDFRIYKVGEGWKSDDIIKNKDGKYSITIDNPDSGYSANFIEIIFDPESEESISFTTGTVVLPNKYPYSKFVIPNPKGKR